MYPPPFLNANDRENALTYVSGHKAISCLARLFVYRRYIFVFASRSLTPRTMLKRLLRSEFVWCSPIFRKAKKKKNARSFGLTIEVYTHSHHY